MAGEGLALLRSGDESLTRRGILDHFRLNQKAVANLSESTVVAGLHKREKVAFLSIQTGQLTGDLVRHDERLQGTGSTEVACTETVITAEVIAQLIVSTTTSAGDRRFGLPADRTGVDLAGEQHAFTAIADVAVLASGAVLILLTTTRFHAGFTGGSRAVCLSGSITLEL